MSKVIIAVMFLWASYAEASNEAINFQAVFKKGNYAPSGPVTGNVYALVLDPADNCVLREESFSGKVLEGGYLNLEIGMGSLTTGGSSLNPAIPLTMSQVFDNSQARTGLKCIDDNSQIKPGVTTAAASATKSRKLRVRLMIDGEEVVADFNMRTVAYSLNSKTLGGLASDRFLRVDEAQQVTQANLTTMLSHATDLNQIVAKFNSSHELPASEVSGLHAVATSGSYNDLSNRPTIPTLVNADWTAATGNAQILNKPTLGSLAAKNSVVGTDITAGAIENSHVSATAAIAWSKIDKTGAVISPEQGGTGISEAPAEGQILYGNSAGTYDKYTLVAGENVVITRNVELKTLTVTATRPFLTAADCPSGYSVSSNFGREEFCVSPEFTRDSWQNAEARCRSEGARLCTYEERSTYCSRGTAISMDTSSGGQSGEWILDARDFDVAASFYGAYIVAHSSASCFGKSTGMGTAESRRYRCCRK